MGVNFGAYIGVNSVWQEVMGLDDKRPTSDQIERMRALIETGLRAGAFGLSAGLDYKPGFWAKTAEVEAIADVARQWRTNFTNHERVYVGNGYSSLAGMAETMEIARTSGMAAVITHMKLQGNDRGKTGRLFAMMAETARNGTMVAADAYPYTFGSTALEQLLIPSWAQEGGRAAMLARFKDPALRPRIVAETITQMDTRWTGPGGVYLPDMKKELTEVMRERGGLNAGETVVRLLEEGHTQVLLRYGTEEDLVRILQYRDTAVSCDCGAQTASTGHPRHWGSYPRFLGRYVREQKIMSWPEAVRRMTALPASIIGLSERGYLRPGMIADITVFDPATIIDHATIDNPTAPSTGIDYVIVNGRVALSGGAPTGLPVGIRLARSQHEPSRRMGFDLSRSVRVSAHFAGGDAASIRLAQRANAIKATGTATISFADGRVIRFTPDLLQASPGWASATGIAIMEGAPHAVTLWMESNDRSQGRPSLTVAVDGKVVLSQSARSGDVVVTVSNKASAPS